MMHRLFVALRLSAPVRAMLMSVMGDVMNARWQDDDQLHLTLRFIGEVERTVAEDIAAALGSIHHPAIELALNGVGTFDRKGRIDTLWAGVTPHDQVAALHRKVDHALVRAGLAPETRAFLPHITLARFGRREVALEPFLQANGGLSSTPFRMEWFALYESSIGHGGASYTLIERYPLG